MEGDDCKRSFKKVVGRDVSFLNVLEPCQVLLLSSVTLIGVNPFSPSISGLEELFTMKRHRMKVSHLLANRLTGSVYGVDHFWLC